VEVSRHNEGMTSSIAMASGGGWPMGEKVARFWAEEKARKSKAKKSPPSNEATNTPTHDGAVHAQHGHAHGHGPVHGHGGVVGGKKKKGQQFQSPAHPSQAKTIWEQMQRKH
jgi:hypothetical protein